MSNNIKSKPYNLDDTFSITMELERPLNLKELENEVYHEDNNKPNSKNLKAIFGIIVIFIIGFFIWTSITYKPHELAKQALISDSNVQVKVDKNIYFTPKKVKPTKGFIFYPGAKVEPEAYAPLCKKIAEEGYQVVIAHMPLNLAILSYNKAGHIIDEFSNIKTWVVGGDSLGGTMASKFATENAKVDGVVFISSYPLSDDLKNIGKDVLSIWGSKDGIVDFEKLIKSKDNLPENSDYVEIEGANHSQFGDYGDLRGDQTPIINRESQINIAANHIIKFMNNIR